MLHVPVTGTGTEHIVQVINVVISFPIDLDDRSSYIFPSILQMWPKCQKGYNTNIKPNMLLTCNGTTTDNNSLQIIFACYLFISPPLTHTHTRARAHMRTCTHTHIHTHRWRGGVVFRSSICPQLHSLAPPKLVIGIQLS